MLDNPIVMMHGLWWLALHFMVIPAIIIILLTIASLYDELDEHKNWHH
jgi:hypothetical protein